ncbi:hypothetical protein NQ318_022834 [Aromia moschata]|uniref:Uncharacterized protein n=1 Tax=Aromia moschata TaxID=1265417 RepID=A0AAV8XUW5_9CUCU|nr:hypothetical protein NQ318_022834 [Aromia moschata]
MTQYNNQNTTNPTASTSYVTAAKSVPKPTFPKKDQVLVLHAVDGLKLLVYAKAIGLHTIKTNLGHKISHRRNVGVDAGQQGFSATKSPGNNSDQLSIYHQRSAGVSLAGVLAALYQSRAQHPVCYFVVAVEPATLVVAQNGHLDHLELAGQALVVLVDGTPSGDRCLFSLEVPRLAVHQLDDCRRIRHGDAGFQF